MYTYHARAYTRNALSMRCLLSHRLATLSDSNIELKPNVWMDKRWRLLSLSLSICIGCVRIILGKFGESNFAFTDVIEEILFDLCVIPRASVMSKHIHHVWRLGSLLIEFRLRLSSFNTLISGHSISTGTTFIDSTFGVFGVLQGKPNEMNELVSQMRM